jgi:uncharacterized phiE125 gp8 family phage protein
MAEIKQHLRIDQTYIDEDSLILNYIKAARQWCEGFNGRVFVNQTWEYLSDKLPIMPLSFPVVPLSEITSITLKDKNDVVTVIEPVNYIIDTDSEPGRIGFKEGISWPNIDLHPFNGVRIEATCGYGTADKTPEIKKQAIMLLVGHLYENREETVEKALQKIPFGVTALLGMDRVVPV